MQGRVDAVLITGIDNQVMLANRRTSLNSERDPNVTIYTDGPFGG